MSRISLFNRPRIATLSCGNIDYTVEDGSSFEARLPGFSRDRRLLLTVYANRLVFQRYFPNRPDASLDANKLIFPRYVWEHEPRELLVKAPFEDHGAVWQDASLNYIPFNGMQQYPE